ncbi:MAG: UPF0175 family protein [Chitinophagales bacterium]|nr:UPF0175 family protein [Chitinophagales bacterium]
MRTVQLNLPDKLDLDPDEVVVFLAAKLFEAGKLTLAQAAQLAGMEAMEFAESLSRYSVSLFNYPESDILKDFENA